MTRKYIWKRLLITGLIFLLLTGILQGCARLVPGFGTWYAHHIYPWIVESIGRVVGYLPFSLAELGLYALLIMLFIDIGKLFVFLFCSRKINKLNQKTVCLDWSSLAAFGSRLLFAVGLLLFLYTANCGINYYAASFSSYAVLEDGTYTVEELDSLCQELVQKVNETVKTGRQAYRENRSSWRAESVRAMQRAGEQFSCLSGFYPKPKEVLVSEILSVQQLCGIYSPFTVEANFNGDMPDYNVPHTLCHELSHLKGFMREDEANFIGYLACISSENEAFCYSGYLTGWVYAGNALARADMQRYIELTNQLCEEAREDLDANSEFWNRYESKVAEAATQMNDTYLKMNSQTDGVQSYGRMVDLMLSYQRKMQGGES